MSMSHIAAKGSPMEALFTEVARRPVLASPSSETLPLALLLAFFATAAFVRACFLPLLKALARIPLRKYFGVEFGDLKLSPLKLSLAFRDVRLSPVESPLLRPIFATLFPSAIVVRRRRRREEGSESEEDEDYPSSELSVETLEVGLRTAGSYNDAAADDGDCAIEGQGVGTASSSRWTRRAWSRVLLRRPIVCVELRGVLLKVEKAYAAPRPPPELLRASSSSSSPGGTSLPSAVPSKGAAALGPEIPTFDQDYALDFLRNDERNDADAVTFWIRRWIHHAEKKTDGQRGEERTDDEKTNDVMRSVLRALLRSMSIRLIDASVLLSGVGSEFAKEQASRRNTRDACATLPKRRRAVTLIGADRISISCCGADDERRDNLLLSLDGLRVKVGDPLSAAAAKNEKEDSAEESLARMTYAWHAVVHPFDVVVELKGIVPIVVWALNYDHRWATRELGLSMNSTEVAVSLSPSHLHTLFLHLDDWTDPNSSFNEWFEWLKNAHSRTLSTTDDEKAAYCKNYARINGVAIAEEAVVDPTGEERPMTPSQLKDLEGRMTRFEITSLRCFAMQNVWKIPTTANGQLEDFLRAGRSSVRDEGEEARATSADESAAFRRLHPTRLDALASFVRSENAFLAPDVAIGLSATSLRCDFACGAAPSSFGLSDLSFDSKLVDPLRASGVGAADVTDAPRLLLSASIEAGGMGWDVLETGRVGELDVPSFPDGSPVGIMYKRRQTPTERRVLSIDANIAVAPTKTQDPLITIDVQLSDLVIISNPLPLLSAMQTLIELSDLPFHLPEEENSDFADKDESQPCAILSTNVNLSVKNTAVLLVTDRRQILRGILDLSMEELAVDFRSIGLSGNLALSTMPVALRTGQITHCPSSSDDSGIEWRVMPFKPIATAEGARLAASAKEKPAESGAPPTIDIEIEIGMGAFLANASPSTMVALMGCASSLIPFIEWARGNKDEKERIRREKELELEEERERLRYRRDALLAIFNSIDVDRSGTLQEEELERVVLMLFADDATFGNDASQIVNGAQRLTSLELARERDYLISILDSGHTNQASFREVHSVLYRMAHGIDDNNLGPMISTGIPHLDGFARSTAFLSAPMMRKLVYFDDLREYAAVHEVYRITGQTRLENGWTFPAPSLWRCGDGIELFWELFTRETGCTRNSPNGQNIHSVQQKLVRSLCNYHFAKFCWKTLVQPQLNFEEGDNESTRMNILTCWLLDNDSQCRINAGVMDRLLMYVDKISKITKEAQQAGKNIEGTHYAVSLDVDVVSAMLRFGSSQISTNPLFEAEFTQVSINASALLSSQTRWFVPEIKGEDNDKSKTEKGNEVHFQSTCSLVYLNTKHNHMETFIQPYPCYGNLLYKTFWQNSIILSDDPQTASFTVKINCPRSLNINALPAFFQTASMLAKIGSKLDPEAYHKLILERDVQVKNCIGRDLGISQGAGHGVIQHVAANSIESISLDYLESQLSFSIERYKIIRHITFSPYQSLMLPLARHRKKPRVNHRRTRANASGFSPHLTVVPNTDWRTLTVRPCVTIQTEIAIRIRIVRLPKSLGYLRKRGPKHAQIDLTKKRLAVALKRLVEGALIIYEEDGISEGGESPLPLNLLDSSSYHALLIQDWTGKNDGTWRDPILLSKDFLFNSMNIREVTKCHALSGVVIQKERLNICLAKNQHNKDVTSDAAKSIVRRTAWDTTIRVVPFFMFHNSMPFPLRARIWQFPIEEGDAIWRDPSLTTKADANEESSTDEESSTTPSIKGRGANPAQFHRPSGAGHSSYCSVYFVERGETLRLSGINLRQSLFIQVSQRLQGFDASRNDFMWPKPLELKLAKLRTGVNGKGSFALSKLPLNLGDNCDCLVDVSIERGIRMPLCTIYSPYWVMNKTGAKLEYKIKQSGRPKHYLDSGIGGLPMMFHCGKSDRELSVIPLECPSQDVVNNWWDVSSNGNLVLKRTAVKSSDQSHYVEWSKAIELDAAGTSGEIRCGNHLFGCHIESLAGAFYRTKLITIAPRYIVKNMLHMPITILPISGSLNDAMEKTREMRQSLSDDEERTVLSLGANESTIIYNFTELKSIAKSQKWVAFSVKALRQVDEFKCKWHIIPIDKMGSTYYGEHDGFNETMCGIIEGKVHGSAEKVVSVIHATMPPIRIENRSHDYYLQLVQDDEDGVAFELPPMHSCGYTWDCPMGKKRLRAVVVKAQSGGHIFKEAAKEQHNDGVSFDNPCNGSSDSNVSCDGSYDNEAAGGPHHSCSISASTRSDSQVSSNMSHFPLKKRRSFGTKVQSYTLSKLGRKKSLPCLDGFSSLSVHLRVSAGTKILSFNDSPWLIEQVEFGLLRKGGDFKSALCDIRIDGLSFYLMDDFPRELMGVTIRDLHIYKPMGTIEASAKVRHFQIDAMLLDARYPIIVQPKLIGVDRHSHIQNNTANLPASLEACNFFWLKNDDIAEPIFEVTISYVPQPNMIWIPNIDVFVCPMKIQLDVDYILRVIGIIIRSISKYQEGATTNISSTTQTNDQLQYTTHGQLKSRLTYIERLYIAPLWFEMEINVKPDELNHSESEAAEEASLTLNSIARSTNSAAVAGILSWIINVGANFAHVSPTFRYATIVDTDRYCDILELARDVVISYIFQSIKQSYKVIFSMELLGDPSYLLHQYRTGISDLVIRSRDEVMAGGKDGFGKGIASFSEHCVGGLFVAFGKGTGGVARTIGSIVSNETTSTHLKPKLPTDSKKRPHHAIEGLAQGTSFLGKSVVHGVAGLIGNPYRGAKNGTSLTKSMTGVAKGTATGLAGLVTWPVIGTLGFMSKTSDGIGATATYLELGSIEARCRPARLVPWGRPMSDNGLSYLKAIGIRVHTVRYQKMRKQMIQKYEADHNGDDNGNVTSKEYKRIRAAEERRKNPPRKVVNILYKKGNRQYVTASTRPKLLSDQPGKPRPSQDHYAVCFEETIILESSDLQLSDEVVIQFRNSKIIRSSLTRAKPSGQCQLTVGDIYAYILLFYREYLKVIESNLEKGIISNSSRTTSTAPRPPGQIGTESLTIPAPQEFSLFRPTKTHVVRGDIFEAISNEMKSIIEAEALDALESDSVPSDSDLSFLQHSGGKNAKGEDKSKIAKANETLFGSISLSFFPVLS